MENVDLFFCGLAMAVDESGAVRQESGSNDRLMATAVAEHSDATTAAVLGYLTLELRSDDGPQWALTGTPLSRSMLDAGMETAAENLIRHPFNPAERRSSRPEQNLAIKGCKPIDTLQAISLQRLASCHF